MEYFTADFFCNFLAQLTKFAFWVICRLGATHHQAQTFQ